MRKARQLIKQFLSRTLNSFAAGELWTLSEAGLWERDFLTVYNGASEGRVVAFADDRGTTQSAGLCARNTDGRYQSLRFRLQAQSQQIRPNCLSLVFGPPPAPPSQLAHCYSNVTRVLT